MKTLQERFEEKIFYSPCGCWLWTGATYINGYGYMYKGPAKGPKSYAHRVSYEIHKGPIPVGKHLLHSCDNPTCVNPDHLRPGSQDENMKDAANKGRAKGPMGKRWKCPKRLTADEAKEIKELKAKGYTATQISRIKGIPFTTVENVFYNRTWINVVLSALVCLFLASSCTEIVEVEKVVTDTLYIEKPAIPKPTLTGDIRIDTVSITLYKTDTVHSTDTIYQVIRDVDSVFIDRVDTIRITETKYVYDTIYIASHLYVDTVFVFAYGRSTFRVHPDLIPIIVEFNTEMREHGKQTPKEGLLFMDVYGDLQPPASWSSWGYEGTAGQWVIEIDPILTPDNAMTPIAREMARRQLGYKYTNDLGPMDPTFDENIVQMNSPQEVKDIYWDNLFK